MKLKVYLWFAILALSLNIANAAQSQDCEKAECPSLYEYDCETDTCVHKEIFPMTAREIFGAILIIIFSGLCTSGGMGGGGVYTPILLIVFSYESSKAIMLVYSMIFGGSLGNFLNVAYQKDIQTGKPVILYDFALIVTPLMVLGSTIGILVNKVIASFITICALLYVVQDMARKIYNRAKTTYAKETSALESPLIQQDDEKSKSPAKPQEGIELVDMSDRESLHSVSVQGTPFAPELEKIIQEEKEALPKTKIIFLFSVIAFIVLIAFLRGTEKYDSLLGVGYCSFGYWIFYLLAPAGCYLFYLKGVQMVKNNFAIKARYNYKDSTYNLKEHDIRKMTLLGLMAGFLSAVIGGGGGMFLGPPLLAMGVGAQSMTATCGLFTVLTSLANLIQAFLLGGFTATEFAFFFSISTIGAYTLSIGISALVKKYQRPSILLFILAGMLFLNIMVLPAFTMYKAFSNPLQMFRFHSLC